MSREHIIPTFGWLIFHITFLTLQFEVANSCTNVYFIIMATFGSMWDFFFVCSSSTSLVTFTLKLYIHRLDYFLFIRDKLNYLIYAVGHVGHFWRKECEASVGKRRWVGQTEMVTRFLQLPGQTEWTDLCENKEDIRYPNDWSVETSADMSHQAAQGWVTMDTGTDRRLMPHRLIQ